MGPNTFGLKEWGDLSSFVQELSLPKSQNKEPRHKQPKESKPKSSKISLHSIPQETLTKIEEPIDPNPPFLMPAIKKKKKLKSNLEKQNQQTQLKDKKKQLDLSAFFSGLKPLIPCLIHVEVTKLPKQIASSFIHVIPSYSETCQEDFVEGSNYIEAKPSQIQFEQLGKFTAILMRPPWKNENGVGITPEQLVNKKQKKILKIFKNYL